MATLQVNGSAVTATSTNNNGGTAVNVGTSALLDTRSPARGTTSVFASTPYDGDDADKVNSGATFAYSSRTPIAPRVSSTLAGLSNDALLGAAGVPSQIRGIHSINSIRTRRLTTAIRAGYWDGYNGTFSVDPTVAVDTFADDNAASVSRSAPGELAYRDGSDQPIQADYPAKNG